VRAIDVVGKKIVAIKQHRKLTICGYAVYDVWGFYLDDDSFVAFVTRETRIGSAVDVCTYKNYEYEPGLTLGETLGREWCDVKVE